MEVGLVILTKLVLQDEDKEPNPECAKRTDPMVVHNSAVWIKDNKKQRSSVMSQHSRTA